MEIRAKMWSGLPLVFVLLTCVRAFNNTNSTGTSDVAAVVLSNQASFSVCVYPVSGSWSFLNRILYYCTLIFSLFSRAHLWLVAGALAAALTYSGVAAVQACLLVWRGPNPYIENDSWVIFSILNLACLITVPLLNWSGTLRRLGAKAASMRDSKRFHTQSDVSTRTIVIYWAFLVLVGFICIWQQIQYGASETNMEYPDMGKVICRAGTNGSMMMSPNGTFHRRAIDSQFIQDNGCSNPCDQINIPSIFRQQNDLTLLAHNQALLWNTTLPGVKYERQQRYLDIENRIFKLTYWTLPFVVVQGIIAVMFGRRDPREIRDTIYINCYMEQMYSGKAYLRMIQDWFVRILAGFNYLLACAVVILCPPLFVISLVSAELQYWYDQPDSEAPYSVGQWGPWAITVQVILAALIARYHDDLICGICILGRHIWGRIRKPKPGSYRDDEMGHVALTKASRDTVAIEPSEGHEPRTAALLVQHSLQVSSPAVPLRKQFLSTETTFNRSLRRALYDLYKTAAHPLNQRDEGLISELMNFIQWCRDPQEVSRHCIRHPVRPRDIHDIHHSDPLPDERKGQDSGYEAKEGVEQKSPSSTERQEDHPDPRDEVRAADFQYRDRLDSGFFRGQKMAQ